jgi:glycosyltransferase involved in cell wall biosynthesis
MTDNYKITVMVPCFNNASSIADVLETVQWADEILLVDSFSTDNTLEIAGRFNVRIVQNEYINQAKQSNWALQYCTHEWVLQIDTDEYLPENAEEIIRNAVENAAPDVHCFRMARRNHVLGKWVKHGGIYPDWEHRLFRRDKGQWFDREVHSNVRVEGKTETLPIDLIHHGMPTISKQLKNLDRYTAYEADELHKKGKSFSYIQWIFRPWIIFGYRYFYQQGFRDGWRGFLLAVCNAFYVFVTYAKLKERKEVR